MCVCVCVQMNAHDVELTLSGFHTGLLVAGGEFFWINEIDMKHTMYTYMYMYMCFPREVGRHAPLS